MRYLFLNVILLVVSVVILVYLAESAYFSPWTESGEVDVVSVSLFIGLLAVIGGQVVSLIVYLGEKFLSYGRNEFPRPGRAMKISLIVTVLIAVLLLLHVYHFLNLPLGLVLCVLIIIGIMSVT